ncbi:DUF4197 family protein [Fontisphaera persica]|uniref:DUF4197 family protein n=1 Tax=Fontisphaera persica TaxID=2974023 RepID=UPI0024C03143|nr:DUF4197 family protein [Fontisphaera persica]WCJ60810.1 DUF4197 family protein [Fontisphaera persica]
MSRKSFFTLAWLAAMGLQLPWALAQNPPAVLDVKPAFMLVTTNVEIKTNMVIVTNFVVVTNITRVTNYYNAAGQLLTPVTPQALPALPPPPAAKPATPDLAQVRAAQLQAIRDLLTQGITAASNVLSKPGAFTSNAAHQIAIPAGVTVFDRKRGEALLQAMNLTAERAVPEAAGLLLKYAGAVQHSNPVEVIRGEPDAATRLLLSSQGEALSQGLVEIVERAGRESKLQEAYANAMLRGGGLLGAVLGTQPQGNVESHVAQGLLRAFAEYLVREEKLVRTNAAARSTPALRQAFAP